MHIRRETFRHSHEFVAVKRIRVSSNMVLMPGDKIDKAMFRRFHLRRLYYRRRIGIEGSPWTEAMLADKDNPYARPEVTGSAVKDTDDSVKPWLIGG